ncbi:DUF6233 domain-containing protein [Streptomyces sp. NPDC001902]
MYELPPDAERLQMLRLYLERQLAAVDARIRKVEQQAAAPAHEPRIGRDPGGWRLQHTPGVDGAGRGIVHRADCPQAAGGWLSRKELDLALGMPEVTACPRCQPKAKP